MVNHRKLLAAGSATVIAEPALTLLSHQPGISAIVGLGVGGLVYLLAGDIEKKMAEHAAERGESRENTPAQPVVPAQKVTNTATRIAYRMLNGKSMRGEIDEPTTEPVSTRGLPTRVRAQAEAVTEKLPEDENMIDFDGPDEDELFTPRAVKSGSFIFSEVLQGFTPTLNKIYIGTLPNGTQVFCKAKDLCHVALAGSTGGGKSSIMRMLMIQLCKAGARVLLLNPHYTRYDLENGEDWTPFDPYLYRPAMECRSYEVIAQYLKQVATEILPKRLDRYAHSQPLGKPYFLVLDEMPAIVHNIKEAPDYLSVILREGRKVGIFLIVASQDFLVKTLFPGGSGGAVRECFRTAFYVGGDGTTAHILLDIASNQIQESDMGKGTIMLRSNLVKPATMAYVPYVDNDALYRLLGPSTFKKQSQIEEDDDLRQPTWEEMIAELNQRPDLQSEEESARLRIVPSSAQRTPQERYQRAIDAYNAGHRSARKLAAALSTPERPVSKEKALGIKNEMVKLGLVQEVSVDADVS